jgi:hypothetical protein
MVLDHSPESKIEKNTFKLNDLQLKIIGLINGGIFWKALAKKLEIAGIEATTLQELLDIFKSVPVICSIPFGDDPKILLDEGWEIDSKTGKVHKKKPLS